MMKQKADLFVIGNPLAKKMNSLGENIMKYNIKSNKIKINNLILQHIHISFSFYYVNYLFKQVY